MSQGSRSCDHCGAAVARHADRFCAYCGTELPLPAPVAAPAAAAEPADLPSRFLSLERWSGLDAALARPPEIRGLMLGQAALPAFLVLWIVMALSMAGASQGVSGHPVFLVFPLALGAVGALAMARPAARGLRFLRAPLRSRLAAVTAVRDQMVGSGERQHSLRYLTLENPEGERREYEVCAATIGAVSSGDLGLAWVKGDHVVTFVRAPV